MLIDADGDEMCESRTAFLTHEEIDAQHLLGRVAIMHPTTMIRRSALEAVGYYREFQIGEDLDLWLRLAEIGRLANLEQVLLKYRFLSGSYSRTKSKLRVGCKRKILEDARLRRGCPDPGVTAEDGLPLIGGAFARKCAKYAISGARFKTARKHAIRAICQSPFTLDSWRMLYHSIVDARSLGSNGVPAVPNA
jgi:hypothetical protein